ncbi:MAG: hypothetical protein JOZ25_07840 [Actinobacteria bacterium]|nr:hypothetical protein [Actinomycetota bacterium]
MAKAKRKRQRKHRGTPAGTIEARGRTGHPTSTRADAKAISRERRAHRLDKPPTWRGALNRAVVMAVIFALVVVVLFKRPVAAAAVLGVAMVLVYLPMSYYTDRFIYNRRQRQKQARTAR